MKEHERLHAIVRGKVQGVGFRYWTIQQAAALGLVGYVRNKWDRTVEVVAEGRRERLEALVRALHQGPRAARVETVEVNWLPATGEFTNFEPRF